MKKITAIFFLSIYLFSTTELSQLLKLPAFIAHFDEHRQENKDLTVWEFLCIHYASDVKKDADYERDMQLPFKTHDNCTAQISVAYPPAVYIFSADKVNYVEKRKHFFHHDVLITSSFHANIWQPPKSC